MSIEWLQAKHGVVVAPEFLAALNRSFVIDAEHLQRQHDFSQATFGPGERTAGVLDHLRKELVEVEQQPDDLSEWADLVILAFDGALRMGFDPQSILDAVLAKQTKNENRAWPDWTTQDPNKAIEHIRDDDIPFSPGTPLSDLIKHWTAKEDS